MPGGANCANRENANQQSANTISKRPAESDPTTTGGVPANLTGFAGALSPTGLPLDVGRRILDFLSLIEVGRNRSIDRYFRNAGDATLVAKLERTGIAKCAPNEMLADAVRYRTEAEEIRRDLSGRLEDVCASTDAASPLAAMDVKFLPLAKTFRHLGQKQAALKGVVDLESLTYRPTMAFDPNREPGNRAVGVNVGTIGFVYEVPVDQYRDELQRLRDSLRLEEYPSRIYEDFRRQLESRIDLAREKQARGDALLNANFIPLMPRPSQEGTLYDGLKDEFAEPLLDRHGRFLSGIGSNRGPSISLDLKESRLAVRLSAAAYQYATEWSLDTIEQHVQDEDWRLKHGL